MQEGHTKREETEEMMHRLKPNSAEIRRHASIELFPVGIHPDDREYVLEKQLRHRPEP
jgi:hypothetical protein